MKLGAPVSTLVLTLLCLLAPLACRIEPDAFRDDDFEAKDGRAQYSWNDQGGRLEVVAQGEIAFLADDSGILSISEGGMFSVEEEADGKTRKWEASPAPDGSISTGYRVDGQTREMDDEGRRWLSGVLPRVLRETGLDAAARTRRILERDGVEGVMAEISKINAGQRSREVYLTELLEASELSEDQLARVAVQVRAAGSGSELTRLVDLVAAKRPGSRRVTRELIETVKGIGSSSLRRQAIEGIVRRRDLDASSAAELAEAASGVRADSEKAAVILTVAEKSPRTPQTAAAFVAAASTIGSSSEKSRVLRELLSKPGIDAGVQAKAARAMADIHSASEKASALTKLAEILSVPDSTAFGAFLDAVGSIDAPSEQDRVLAAFLARTDLDAASLGRILAFVQSDFPEGPLRQRLVEKIRRKIAGE